MTVLTFNVTPLSLLKRGHCPPKLNTIVFSEGGERGELKTMIEILISLARRDNEC